MRVKASGVVCGAGRTLSQQISGQVLQVCGTLWRRWWFSHLTAHQLTDRILTPLCHSAKMQMAQEESCSSPHWQWMKNLSLALFFFGVLASSSSSSFAPSFGYFLCLDFLRLPIFLLTVYHLTPPSSPSIPSLSPGILFTVFDLGIPFLPRQTKQPQTSLNCNPQCAHTHTHMHTLPSSNHTQEMGSHANEARLASGTQDGVSGLKTFSSRGNWTWSFSPSFHSPEFPLLFLLTWFMCSYLCSIFPPSYCICRQKSWR